MPNANLNLNLTDANINSTNSLTKKPKIYLIFEQIESDFQNSHIPFFKECIKSIREKLRKSINA